MSGSEKVHVPKSKFYLNKWYLDFISVNGEAMIFYAAQLIWHGVEIPYSSYMHHKYSGETEQKSGFHINFPKQTNNLVIWNDKDFGIHGTWKKSSEAIHAQIFESEKGELNWHCYQPSSITELEIQGKKRKGTGYVEQLIITIPVWVIPMDELRWGHVVSEKHKIVWIELKGGNTNRWLWLNGELMKNYNIKDDLIFIYDKNFRIYFDRNTVLESEKKLTSLANKLKRFIPGIKNLIPINFLLADECKWFSKVTIEVNNKIVENGFSIHEFVNFKPLSD